MAAKKLSQITQGSPGGSDFLVGVTAGGSDRLFLVSSVSGSTAAGGSNTDVQFNAAGILSGDGGFTYPGSGGSVTVSPAANTVPFIITGGSTTGSGTNILGLKVTGTLNTTGVVDGAALFANVTKTAVGAGSTLLDLQVGGSTVFNIDTSGNVAIAGSGEVSSATSLTIAQTGDSFGSTAFALQNRFGVNGAIFEQLGTVSVCDFVFLINGSGGFNGQSNIRYERRTGNFLFSSNTVQEFQIGGPFDGVHASTNPAIIAGDTVSGTLSPGATLARWIIGGSTHSAQVEFSTGAWQLAWRLETTSANFLSSLNTNFEVQSMSLTGGGGRVALGDQVNWFLSPPQFNTNTTGAGSALLGANCPAVTVSAPYTWITAHSSDGSTVYIPVWK